MTTLTTLTLLCTFFSGVAAGAWMNDFAHRPRRPTAR